MSQQSFPTRTSRHQRGVAIIVALMVLVAMSLGAIALMRSVDTAALIAGNLAFRQGATLGGETGIEDARSILLTVIADRTVDSISRGYYASTPESDKIDLTGNRLADKSYWVRWPGTDGSGQTPVCLPADAATGNQACYIVHRLCDEPGEVADDKCYTFSRNGYGGEGGPRSAQRDYGPPPPDKQLPDQVYYRITVRTQGPRNNVSFLQAFVVI